MAFELNRVPQYVSYAYIYIYVCVCQVELKYICTYVYIGQNLFCQANQNIYI